MKHNMPQIKYKRLLSIAHVVPRSVSRASCLVSLNLSPFYLITMYQSWVRLSAISTNNFKQCPNIAHLCLSHLRVPCYALSSACNTSLHIQSRSYFHRQWDDPVIEEYPPRQAILNEGEITSIQKTVLRFSAVVLLLTLESKSKSELVLIAHPKNIL
jgi:hypothetical protein